MRVSLWRWLVGALAPIVVVAASVAVLHWWVAIAILAVGGVVLLGSLAFQRVLAVRLTVERVTEILARWRSAEERDEAAVPVPPLPAPAPAEVEALPPSPDVEASELMDLLLREFGEADISDRIEGRQPPTPRTLVVLYLEVPEASLAVLDDALADARFQALAARLGTAGPASCEIVTAGFLARTVLLDSVTRDHFLAAAQAGSVSAVVRVGEARYPENGLTASALLAAARKRLRPLSDL